MKTQSVDTNIKAEKLVISLMREKSIAEKFAMVQDLSQTTMQLSLRAIAKANKNLKDEQVQLEFIKNHYGEKVANRYANCLKVRCETT